MIIYYLFLYNIVSPAMHYDAAGMCVVKGAYFLAQCYEGCGTRRHSVVGPRREVKLFDVACLSVLQM